MRAWLKLSPETHVGSVQGDRRQPSSSPQLNLLLVAFPVFYNQLGQTYFLVYFPQLRLLRFQRKQGARGWKEYQQPPSVGMGILGWQFPSGVCLYHDAELTGGVWGIPISTGVPKIAHQAYQPTRSGLLGKWNGETENISSEPRGTATFDARPCSFFPCCSASRAGAGEVSAPWPKGRRVDMRF